MGYTVNYGPAQKGRRSRRRIRLRIPLVALGLILSVLLARYIWPQQTQRLRQALFPWTRETVQEALAGLQENLENGETVSDAITAFCLEVLSEADIAQ